jgi:hypothetical protein
MAWVPTSGASGPAERSERAAKQRLLKWFGATDQNLTGDRVAVDGHILSSSFVKGVTTRNRSL